MNAYEVYYELIVMGVGSFGRKAIVIAESDELAEKALKKKVKNASLVWAVKLNASRVVVSESEKADAPDNVIRGWFKK